MTDDTTSQDSAPEAPSNTQDQVLEVLEKIRPFLQRDGGDLEFVSYEDGRVSVRLQGACAGCPSSQMTLKMGIERALRDQIPAVKEVVAV